MNMNTEARASLRHFLSAALIFGKGLDDKRDPRTRALEAFDEWFRLHDSKAKQPEPINARWPFQADAKAPGIDDVQEVLRG